MIRNGTYTLYKSQLFPFTTVEGKVNLVFEGDEPPLPEFRRFADKMFMHNFPFHELSNACFITTKCIYKRYVFDVEEETEECVLIVSADQSAKRELWMEHRNTGGYQKLVKRLDLESIWEERTSAFENMPYPDNLPRLEKIIVDGI